MAKHAVLFWPGLFYAQNLDLQGYGYDIPVSCVDEITQKPPYSSGFSKTHTKFCQVTLQIGHMAHFCVICPIFCCFLI